MHTAAITILPPTCYSLSNSIVMPLRCQMNLQLLTITKILVDILHFIHYTANRNNISYMKGL